MLYYKKHMIVSDIIPHFLRDHGSLAVFFGCLSYALFSVHWVLSTDWESKFNWLSVIVCLTGILHLHYSNALLIHQYEPLFFSTWTLLFLYHASVWKSNYGKIRKALESSPVVASLKPFDGSIFRYFVTIPTMKNAAGQWDSPPFRNTIHIILLCLYILLMVLHTIPYFTPMECIGEASRNCCRYNYVMNKFNTQSLNINYCSGPVRIAFVGSWSTGKTSIINSLLGHSYSTAQISPSPSTDKFVCIALGASYNDPIRSDDYDLRKNCDIISHINEITYDVCGNTQPNIVDIADMNSEFEDFVFFDTPGFQQEYSNDCSYEVFYKQLIEKMDFVYVVWDVNHGKIDESFSSLFQNKAHGVDYEMIFNRYGDDQAGNGISFLNQQYAKMTKGHELLSEGYVLKLHENRTKYQNEFVEDIRSLRTKILSVNQTVHDQRKLTMKENLIRYRSKITGFDSLRKIKMADRMIQKDLNIHMKPVHSHFEKFGFEL